MTNKKPPEIATDAVIEALDTVSRAERSILAFAQELGLPIDTVSIYETRHVALVRLSSYRHRLFKNEHAGRRDLSEKSAALGPHLWKTIEDAAAAYKAKHNAA